ncbi:hypothetical protein C8F04DRAFT_1174746 [Mycena alexandri]|uniref:Uncharacterized protein n=1 Tax=Mycena alexandri TaxID=1745969 RepID=A0AAD6TDQ6_9AGAR|nr:hypothetical protein C8F04DRAFT_1174746 [Mycena alexandri]
MYTVPIARERRVDGLGKGRNEQRRQRDSTWMGTANGQRGSEYGTRYTHRRRETYLSFVPGKSASASCTENMLGRTEDLERNTRMHYILAHLPKKTFCFSQLSGSRSN